MWLLQAINDGPYRTVAISLPTELGADTRRNLHASETLSLYLFLVQAISHSHLLRCELVGSCWRSICVCTFDRLLCGRSVLWPGQSRCLQRSVLPIISVDRAAERWLILLRINIAILSTLWWSFMLPIEESSSLSGVCVFRLCVFEILQKCTCFLLRDVCVCVCVCVCLSVVSLKTAN